MVKLLNWLKRSSEVPRLSRIACKCAMEGLTDLLFRSISSVLQAKEMVALEQTSKAMRTMIDTTQTWAGPASPHVLGAIQAEYHVHVPSNKLGVLNNGMVNIHGDDRTRCMMNFIQAFLTTQGIALEGENSTEGSHRVHFCNATREI